MTILASKRVLLSRRCVSGSAPDFIIETQPRPSVEATMSVWPSSDHRATSKWQFRPPKGCYSVEGVFWVPTLIWSLKPNQDHQWRLPWVFKQSSNQFILAYQYINTITIFIPKVPKSTKKYQKVPKSNQMCPKVLKDPQNAKKYPKRTKRVPKSTPKELKKVP